MKKPFLIITPLLLVVLLFAAGCAAASTPTPTPPGGTTPTTTSTPAATTSPSTPTTTAPATTTSTSTPSSTATTSPSGTTFQQLATNGQTTYAKICSVCHGANGGGTGAFPALWGSKATLGSYSGNTLFSDAQGMLSFISKAMPFTAPGSLTHQQYVDVMAYILIKANIVQPSTIFNESHLSTIKIK